MFNTLIILFLFAISGFGVAAGLFLRVEAKLAQANGKIPILKYWGSVLSLLSLTMLCFLILLRGDGLLIFGLGLFFGTAVLALLYFYFLYLFKQKPKK